MADVLDEPFPADQTFAQALKDGQVRSPCLARRVHETCALDGLLHPCPHPHTHSASAASST